MRWQVGHRYPTRVVVKAALCDLLVSLTAGVAGYAVVRLMIAAIAGPSPKLADVGFLARCFLAFGIVTDWVLRWRQGYPRR